MEYRIMQLQYKPNRDEANIKQGITLKRPYQKVNCRFGTIESAYKPYKNNLEIYNFHDYEVLVLEDRFTGIVLHPPVVMKVEKENAIMLIVEYSEEIHTTNGVEKIAGRYPDGGIFILRPNDKISVKKGSLTEEFVALQFENKMYLVKIHTD